MIIPGTTITYNDVFKNYIENILGKKYYYIVDENILNNLTETDEVKEMPCYPEFGYCKMVDGYLVMKFTE